MGIKNILNYIGKRYANVDDGIIKIYRDNSRPSYFMVDWMLHDKCTYDCSYCPPANKSGTDSWLNLETLDEFCQDLEKHVYSIDPNFKIKVLFTGGEPTVWKDFGELVTRLSARGWLLMLNSNGSRTERWWEEYADKFIEIIISYHTESVNDDEFIRKLQICQDKTITSVNVMLNPNPEYFSKAVAISSRIRKEASKVSITHYKIQHTFGLQEINVPQYTVDQLEIASQLQDWQYDGRPDLDNYRIQLSNGKTRKLDAIELLNKGLVNFKDWTCHAGLESIFIDAKGSIVRATCRAGEKFGNVRDPKNIKWSTDPIVCPHLWCGCITDIKNSKEK
jgi:MoaA/NifB/PqqE/SkfB family radical SAM enzyme